MWPSPVPARPISTSCRKDRFGVAHFFFNADGGSLYLRNETSLQFEVAQKETLKRQKGKDFLLFKPYEISISPASIAGYVALTGETLNIPNVYDLSPDLPYRFNPSFDLRNNYQTQSLLAVPLRDQKRDDPYWRE